MENKENYYFTFGQKYSYERHPMYPKAHPNGWVRIVARTYKEAREYAFNVLFGDHFAKQYDEIEWDSSYFPGGEIECIEI